MNKRKIIEYFNWIILGLIYVLFIVSPALILINYSHLPVFINIGWILPFLFLLFAFFEIKNIFHVNDEILKVIVGGEVIVALVMTLRSIEMPEISIFAIILMIISVILGFITLTFGEKYKTLRIRNSIGMLTIIFSIYALIMLVQIVVIPQDLPTI